MGISPIQLLIVLIIVVLIFGGKRLRTLGSDLGSAIKGFKNEMNSDNNNNAPAQNRVSHEQGQNTVIEGEVSKEKTS